MPRILRVIGAVALGSVLWAVLWNLGTQGAKLLWPSLLADVERVTHTGILLMYVGYGSLVSVVAGFVTATAAGERPMRAVWILAILHQTLGIAAEISYWQLMPVWYHIVYLALVIPATLTGGWLRERRAALRTVAP